MDPIRPATEVLEDEACWEYLRGAAVGRIAVDVGGQPDIFPINYLVDDGSIFFRSGAGTKLAAAVLMQRVALEIDGFEPHGRTAWSVVVKGRARQVERMDEVFEAEDLPLFPWVASPKPNVVRIEPESVTGRRFHVVDEVTPDASLGWIREEDGKPPEIAVEMEPGAEHHPGEPFLRPG